MKRVVVLMIGCLMLAMQSLAMADEQAGGSPPVEQLVWQFPHEIIWKQGEGARWYSIGHTATALVILPNTQDGKLIGAELQVHLIESLDEAGNITKTKRIDTKAFAITEADASKQKRGLHRKRKNSWDFGFGNLPDAPYTAHHRFFFEKPPQFRYCLTVHVEDEKAKLGESFENLRIYVLVAELLDNPNFPATQSWPDGEPMPAGIQPDSNWLSRETLKPIWANQPKPIKCYSGPVTVENDTIKFGPAKVATFANDLRDTGLPNIDDAMRGETEDIQLEESR